MSKQTATGADAGGRLFVVSAPSGTGKTTITSRLRQMEIISVSVSHTTRAPREGEKDGAAYFFVAREEFLSMRDSGAFLEWAQVYGNYYGTSRDWVQTQLAAGRHVLLEIDCQGARQIHQLIPQAVMIFISPPDMDTLRRRLLARRQDDDEALRRRLAEAEKELAQKKFFDYVIINDDLEDAVRKMASIIRQSAAAQ